MTRRWLLVAFFLSGVGALGFELLWVRHLGLVLGAETFGILAVLAGFFGGLALGAALFHTRIAASSRPARLYAACEGIIAGYGLLSPWLLLQLVAPIPSTIGGLVGDNRSAIALLINLSVAAALLLPATVPMGVTTAALVEAWRRCERDDPHYSVGPLYAANTLGATAGIILSTYWLLPKSGAVAGAALLAAVCVAAAVIALAWERRRGSASAPAAAGHVSMPRPESSRVLYIVLFTTGLAGIGFEAVCTQILAQIFENTVYTFANVLAVYLIGTSAGAWLYTRPWARALTGDRDRATVVLLYALSLSVFASAAVLVFAPFLLGAIAPAGSPYSVYLVAEVLVTAAVFLVPTMLMGAAFSHLLGQCADRGVGYGYAVNTLGGTLAPFLFGLLLVERVGYGLALWAVAVPYLASFAWLSFRTQYRPAGLAAALAVAAAVVFVWNPRLVLVRPVPGYRLVAQAQGLHGTVSVSQRTVQSAAGPASTIRLLQVNQNFLMGGAFGYLEKRIGHLALLLAREPRDVLFLGVGTGITAGAALSYPDVRSITGVEIVPEILHFLNWFADHNHDLANDPRVVLHASDARRFLRASDDSYDVIVGELFHPTVNGAGGLFTREHFRAAKQRLRPGGLFVQWLPLYQLSPRDLATVVRTFLEVFPDAHGILGTYSAEAALGLFTWAPDAQTGGAGIDMDRVANRVKGSSRLRDVVGHPEDLLAAYLTDASGLREFAGPGPLNTDLNQRILFDAPFSLGGISEKESYRSLEALLPYRRTFPDDLLWHRDAAAAARWRSAAEPTTAAATHFLAGEIHRMRAPQGALPGEAVTEYLRAYERNPGFANASQMLIELAGRHPQAARRIAGEMARLNPRDTGIVRAYERLAYAQGQDAVVAVLRDYLRGM